MGLRKSNSIAHQFRSEYDEASETLFSERDDTRDITSDLSRQYKTMESQLMTRIIALEEQNEMLQCELGPPPNTR
jgi:hypothetical protein